MSDPKRRDLLPGFLDAFSVAAGIYLLSLIILRFDDYFVLAPLLIGLVVGCAAGEGRLRLAFRASLLIILMAGATILFFFALLAEPRIVALTSLCALPPLFANRLPSKVRLGLSLLAMTALSYGIIHFFAPIPSLIWRLVPGLLAPAALLAFPLRRKETALRRGPYFFVLLALVAAPALGSRLLPCNALVFQAVSAQPQVDVIFDNKTSVELPENRQEILCDSSSGIFAIMPAEPSHRVGIIHPDGTYKSVLLYGEAPAHSSIKNGVVYTGAKGQAYAIDLATAQVSRSPRMSSGNFSSALLSSSGDTLALTDPHGERCRLIKREDLSIATDYALHPPGQCLPLSDAKLLLSETNGTHHRLALLDIATGQVIVERQWLDLTYGEMAVDEKQKLIYLPSSLLGIVRVFSLDTLDPRGWFADKAGVRGALLSPDGSRLYTWTEIGGQLIEHELPYGKIRNQWQLGRSLIGVNWDADGAALLAASCLGGFRINILPW